MNNIQQAADIVKDLNGWRDLVSTKCDDDLLGVASNRANEALDLLADSCNLTGAATKGLSTALRARTVRTRLADVKTDQDLSLLEELTYVARAADAKRHMTVFSVNAAMTKLLSVLQATGSVSNTVKLSKLVTDARDLCQGDGELGSAGTTSLGSHDDGALGLATTGSGRDDDRSGTPSVSDMSASTGDDDKDEMGNTTTISGIGSGMLERIAETSGDDEMGSLSTAGSLAHRLGGKPIRGSWPSDADCARSGALASGKPIRGSLLPNVGRAGDTAEWLGHNSGFLCSDTKSLDERTEKVKKRLRRWMHHDGEVDRATR